jgi:hypothetical protein
MTALDDRNTTSTLRPTGLPDERFWVRYSPHHELPLSGTLSAVLHVLVLILLLVGAWLVVKLGWSDQEPQVPFIEVVVDSQDPPGGLGNGGVGGGVKKPGGQEEDLGQQQALPTRPPDRTSPPELTVPKGVPPIVVPDPDGQPLFREAEEARRRIEEAIRLKTPGRKGGPGGTEAGLGGGPKGDGKGPDGNPRQKRVLRWTLVFSTLNGEDYVRQLHALGAVLAVPNPDRPPDYLVVRNLTKRPAVARSEDVAKINRIYWVDSKPESVAGVVQALGLPKDAPYFVAFFPEELEKKLLELELKFANRREEDIKETQFRILRKGNSYEPQVIEQR